MMCWCVVLYWLYDVLVCGMQWMHSHVAQWSPRGHAGSLYSNRTPSTSCDSYNSCKLENQFLNTNEGREQYSFTRGGKREREGEGRGGKWSKG